MKKLLSMLLLTCVLFVYPVYAGLPSLEKNEVYFDGAGHCDQVKSAIVNLIDSTECELLVQMYDFTNHEEVKPIFQAIERARARNVTVKIYLSREGANNPSNKTGFPEPDLEKLDVQVHWKPSGVTMHRKLWLSDCYTIFIGSSNISDSSFNSNDEVDMRIQDSEIAAKIKEVFDQDWLKSCENYDLSDCKGN